MNSELRCEAGSCSHRGTRQRPHRLRVLVSPQSPRLIEAPPCSRRPPSQPLGGGCSASWDSVSHFTCCGGTRVCPSCCSVSSRVLSTSRRPALVPPATSAAGTSSRQPKHHHPHGDAAGAPSSPGAGAGKAPPPNPHPTSAGPASREAFLQKTAKHKPWKRNVLGYSKIPNFCTAKDTAGKGKGQVTNGAKITIAQNAGQGPAPRVHRDSSVLTAGDPQARGEGLSRHPGPQEGRPHVEIGSQGS